MSDCLAVLADAVVAETSSVPFPSRSAVASVDAFSPASITAAVTTG